jgi:hypothetical protein
VQRGGGGLGRQPALEVPVVRRLDPLDVAADDTFGQPAVGLDLRELGQG